MCCCFWYSVVSVLVEHRRVVVMLPKYASLRSPLHICFGPLCVLSVRHLPRCICDYPRAFLHARIVFAELA